MPNVKLKNKMGNAKIYSDVDKIQVLDENDNIISYTYNYGNLDITKNGNYNVNGKETVNVNVEGGGISKQSSVPSTKVTDIIDVNGVFYLWRD